MMVKTINHEETRNKIISIAEDLISQAEAVAAYIRVKLELADGNVYSEEYKSQKLNEAWQIYLGKLEDVKAAIKEKLEAIREVESENEKIIELDSVEFANALSIVEVTKGKVPPETQKTIAESFAGKLMALDTIARAIGNHGGNISEEFKEYLINADRMVEKLSVQTNNLEQSSDTAAISLKNLFDDVISYGEKLGLNLEAIKEKAAASLGPEYDAAKERQLRLAMGID